MVQLILTILIYLIMVILRLANTPSRIPCLTMWTM